MSKLAAQRAMREANYAARQATRPPASGVARAAAGEPPVAPPVTPPATGRAAAPSAEGRSAKHGTAAADGPFDDSGETATCGHTSMNGRRCTREAGHPQKSHRYS